MAGHLSEESHLKKAFYYKENVIKTPTSRFKERHLQIKGCVWTGVSHRGFTEAAGPSLAVESLSKVTDDDKIRAGIWKYRTWSRFLRSRCDRCSISESDDSCQMLQYQRHISATKQAGFSHLLEGNIRGSRKPSWSRRVEKIRKISVLFGLNWHQTRIASGWFSGDEVRRSFKRSTKLKNPKPQSDEADSPKVLTTIS